MESESNTRLFRNKSIDCSESQVVMIKLCSVIMVDMVNKNNDPFVRANAHGTAEVD
jgi:hypothetical protein